MGTRSLSWRFLTKNVGLRKMSRKTAKTKGAISGTFSYSAACVGTHTHFFSKGKKIPRSAGWIFFPTDGVCSKNKNNNKQTKPGCRPSGVVTCGVPGPLARPYKTGCRSSWGVNCGVPGPLPSHTTFVAHYKCEFANIITMHCRTYCGFCDQ